jgi:cell division protein FtsA
VLTGGAALLDGVAEVAEQIFDLPIRRGSPTDLGGMVDHVSSPVFATCAGLLRYAQRAQANDGARAGAIGWFAGRVRGLFKEFF